MDMVDPQPPLVELLVRHVLLPREFLPQIEINSIERTKIRFSEATQLSRDGEPQQPVPPQVGEILHRKLARTVVVQRPLGEGCCQGLTLMTERFLLGGRG